MNRQHDAGMRAQCLAGRLAPEIEVVAEHGADLQTLAALDRALEQAALAARTQAKFEK